MLKFFFVWDFACIIHFCFLVIFLLLMLGLSVLLLVSVTSLLPRFFMQSSSRWIDALTVSWMLTNPLPPSFLDTCSLFTLSLACKALWIVVSFLVLSSIPWGSTPVHFKNGPAHLTRQETAKVSILLMRLLLCSSVSSYFLVWIFFFFHLCLVGGVRFQNYQVFVSFLFSDHSDLHLVFLFLPSYVFYRYPILA